MNSHTNGPPKPSFLSITYFPHNTHLECLHWPKHPFLKRRCQVIQTTKHIWVISSILIIYNFSPNRIRLQTISEDPSTYFVLNNTWNARRTSSIQCPFSVGVIWKFLGPFRELGKIGWLRGIQASNCRLPQPSIQSFISLSSRSSPGNNSRVSFTPWPW